MKIDSVLIETLLYGEEGVDLDFKRDQYKFIKATDEEKAELLKDILAFANSWRRSDAFILIGVEEVKGGKSNVVGISEKIDDAQLQQFVNSKTQKPITFSYHNLDFENNDIGVIHIPVQNRPFYLKRDFANLKSEKVYIKRGSSTDIAKLDEISQMGTTSFFQEESYPVLEIFFVDKKKREILPDTLKAKSIVLNTPRLKDIPDYKGDQRRPKWPVGFEIERPNYDYYRKLVTFTTLNRLHIPINFAIKNSGAVVAKDVRVEIKISDPQSIIKVLDEYDMPKVPKSSYSTFDTPIAFHKVPLKHDLTAKRVSNYWLVEASVEKVQPKNTEWVESYLFIGALESIDLCLEVFIYSDNLPEPITKKLVMKIESEKLDASLEVIKELERDRLRNSEEFKEFLEKHLEKFEE